MNFRSPARVGSIGLVAILSSCFLGTPAIAQQTSDPQTMEQLLKRLSELEARLKEVEARNPPAPTGAPAAAPAVAPGEPVSAAVSAADQAEANAILQQAASGNATGHTFGKMSIVGFSDFTFGRPLEENLPPGGVAGSSNSFTMGDLSLFITSQLTPKVSFYSEALFTADFTNSWGAEVDRLVLQYKANDYFQVGVGRFNTALGYYTNGINRAKIFQTATDRPFMYTDEDAGGLLPVHSVGVTMTGKLPSGGIGLHWVAELSNGTASLSATAEPVQSLYDENNRKAYNLGLFIKPERLDGFQAGVSVYRDKLEPAGLARVDENIVGAYAVYVRPTFEFMNETAIISYSPTNGTPTYKTGMGYSQISRRFGRTRPYLRLEYQSADRYDLNFPNFGTRKSFEAGVRRDLAEFFAIKAQIGRTYWNHAWAYDPQVQLAFTF
ncbi:MAG TPA: hypothetical protein VGG72_24475 [Bryobacteraceae bacterium]